MTPKERTVLRVVIEALRRDDWVSAADLRAFALSYAIPHTNVAKIDLITMLLRALCGDKIDGAGNDADEKYKVGLWKHTRGKKLQGHSRKEQRGISSRRDTR